ncbi:hypothetical protein [Salana multivorans]
MACPLDPAVTSHTRPGDLPEIGLIQAALHVVVTNTGEVLVHMHRGLDDDPALAARVLGHTSRHLRDSAHLLNEAAKK